MSRPRDAQFEEGRLFLLGRIIGSGPHRSPSLRGYVATAGSGGRVFDRTTSDGTGRFLLEFDRGTVRGHESVEVFVTSPSGLRIGAQSAHVNDLDSPKVLLFQVGHTETAGAATVSHSLIERFVANEEPAIVVDSSCSGTVLEWKVRSDSRDFSEMLVVLAENRRPIAGDLPAQGSRSVKSSRTAEYTLSVRASSGAETLTDSKTVTVKRLPTLAVYYDVIHTAPNTQITVGVVISCPAPDGDLRVGLVSSDFAKVNGGEVVIAAGTTWGSTTLSTGTGTGDVELTGTASGYLRDTVHLTMPSD